MTLEITGLGYIGLQSPDTTAWRAYGSEVIGFGLGAPPATDPDTVYLRMDERIYRIAIHPGPIDELLYIGWETSGRLAYERAVAKLQAEGIEFETADADLCQTRGVRSMTRFKDPVGYVHEIFYAQKSEVHTFRPGRAHGGFVAEEQGLGHIVLATPTYDDALEHFLFKVLGLEWFCGGIGQVNMGLFRPPLNRRSHSIGYVHTPGKIGIQHFGIPFRELDDVGIAFDIAERQGVQLQRTIGRHTQESVISFYMFNPSGFLVECFCEVGDWNKAVEANPNVISMWGHKHLAPLLGRTVRPV